MTPEDIKKLATPETDMWEFPATVAGIRGSRCVASGLSRSLEQRLTAAMMDLEWFKQRVENGEVISKRTYARFCETLASIRQMKEGK